MPKTKKAYHRPTGKKFTPKTEVEVELFNLVQQMSAKLIEAAGLIRHLGGEAISVRHFEDQAEYEIYLNRFNN